MRLQATIIACLTCSAACVVALAAASTRERQPQTARVTIEAGRAGCQVDLDAAPVGTTDAAGNLTIATVDPGDHYLHVHCLGQAESVYFISPKANENVRLRPAQQLPSPATARDPTALADDKAELQRLVQQAVQLRVRAHFDEAVAALRQAQKLDPENSDLHRELGITFLLAKEWKRARVEMIEALRYDPNDADAHNGLGYTLEKLGDIDSAVNEYRTATRLEPDDPIYRTHYLDALVKIQARKEIKK
jgi:tetratricopeptide (TPR) repeat protein